MKKSSEVVSSVNKKPHTLSIENRASGNITGVIKVISSNSGLLSLDTSHGGLNLTGSDLKIVKYNQDDGLLAFEGSVNQVKYSAAKVPFLKRMFS